MAYSNSIVTTEYGYLWNKYRPALLRLMIDAKENEQTYKFTKHDFVSVKPVERKGYTFELTVQHGKSVNLIKDSNVAKDLLVILQQSAKANELMETAQYTFKLDKQFLLHVTYEEAIPEEETTTEE